MVQIHYALINFNYGEERMKMLTICRTIVTYLIGICLALAEVATSVLSRAVEYVLAVDFNSLGKELFSVAVHGLVKMITFPVTFADHFEKSCASFVAMLKGIGAGSCKSASS